MIVRLLILLFAMFATNEAVYIERFTTVDNGGILFTGNTLGLSKFIDKNQPGTSDAAGAFITANTASQVGTYLPGTTLDWHQNNSTAFLDLPANSKVLYAELIWSGSYGFNGQITSNEPDTPITMITPQNNAFTITPDPTTAQKAVTPGYASGNYTRSANVTSIVQAAGEGMYTVGGIPATISALDNTHNAAGWTLAVVFHNGQLLTYNMTVFVGCEQASSNLNQPASMSGFCAPPSGPLTGNLFVSAIEGDANKMGDCMLFGHTLPLTIAANALSGANNPINNFFGSQINTLLSLSTTRVPLKLVNSSSGAMLDTRGSFGNFNANPVTGIIMPGDRQGYDITSVDISDKLVYNQTTAYALGTTTGDDYTINAVGLQIEIGSPNIEITKQVNGQSLITARVGETVTFSFTIENTGTSDAFASIFKDILEAGLNFVPGSFKVNGIVQPDPNLNAGYLIGDMLIGQRLTVEFQVLISSAPSRGSLFNNQGIVDYQFISCLGSSIELEAASNVVTIGLPSQNLPNIVVTKLVNSMQSIDSSVGEVVTFTFALTNTGKGDAYNVILKDILEQGLTVIPGSVLVDNVIVFPEPDLHEGVLIGDVAAGQTVHVLFQVKINGYPQLENTYFNFATVDQQYMPFDSEFVDLITRTNTVSMNVRPSPPFCLGFLEKCSYLNKKKTFVLTFWVPTRSTGVVYYRIYHKGKIIATVPASDSLKYSICLHSKKTAKHLKISAVYPGNVESTHVKLRIINE